MWRVPSLQVVATEIFAPSGPMAVTGTKFAQTPHDMSFTPVDERDVSFIRVDHQVLPWGVPTGALGSASWTSPPPLARPT